MKYYIFKVKDSAGKTYYVINNMYLGYLGFDSHPLRSILESDPKITQEYQLYAKGLVANDRELHKLFASEDNRITKTKADRLIKKYKLEPSTDKNWYKIIYPDPNCSTQQLIKVTASAGDNIFVG